MRSPLALAAALALALPALALGAGDASTHEVAMLDVQFQPSQLTIRAGDTVVWHNLEDLGHTTTLAPLWDSGEMLEGDAFSVTFAVPGVFPYRCEFHVLMLGTIVVEP